MARLDKMIEFMRQKSGKRFIMRSNDSCVLYTEAGRQPLNRVMSAQEVETVVTEVLPRDLADQFQNGGTFVFPYKTAQGQVILGVSRPKGKLEVTIGMPGEQVLQVDEPVPVRPAPEPPKSGKKAAAAQAAAATGPASAAPASATAPAAASETTPTPAPATVAPAPGPVATPLMPAPMAIPARVKYAAEYLPNLLRYAQGAGATDLHLHAAASPRLRISGRVEEYAYGEILKSDQLESALLDLLPPERQREWVATGITQYCFNFNEQVRLRGYFFRDRMGPAAVFRLLAAEPPTIEGMGLPPVIGHLARAERGLILVSGPRVSGRTTTMAALVSEINAERHAHVVTVEEAIEFPFRHQQSVITQWEIPTHVPSYVEALRRLAMANADVVTIADMTSAEALEEALIASECGMLVIGVLHLPDVVSLIGYVINVLTHDDAERVSRRISQALQGAVCQFMCTTVAGDNQVPVFEALVTNSAVASLIRDRNLTDLQSMMSGGEDGMMTFNDSLLQRLQQKFITPQEALRRSRDQTELQRMFTRNRIALA